MLECDLVMKGGVTSGTVYPKAIVRLAKDYRLRSIGGTSAGAIAAAAAAAAEYRRQNNAPNPMAGFDELARLPEELGKPGSKKMGATLLELFQAQAPLRPLLGFVLSFIGLDRTKKGDAKPRGWLSRIATWLLIGRVCLRAIRHFWGHALLGLVASLAFAWLLGVSFDWSWRLLALAALAFAGASASALWGVWRAVQKLPANGFGMCRGFEPSTKGESEDGTHLTPWLHAMIQRTAGRAPEGAPLTFGNLNSAKIQLRVVTSNLCYGHPHRLPFGQGEAWPFFDPSEWAQFFPARVIKHLTEEENRPKRAKEPETENNMQYAAAVKRIQETQNLYPLPDEEKLPVIVAVRMSLSFPLLLSALPLHMLDPRKHDTDPARKCWFSDGGISSNFPLHFFDSPITDRPTFAINLQEVERVAPGTERVILPKTNRDGLVRAWKEIAEKRGETTALADFLLAIFNVMQNWRDSSLLRLPGYRDRVATVQLEPHQGGLNLNMPEDLIKALAGYGEAAADQLAWHFLPQNADACRKDGIETTWDNHRWVRLLSTLAGLERLFDEMDMTWKVSAGPAGTYEDLLDPKKTPVAPSYLNFTREQRDLALKSLADARRAIQACRQAIPAESMTKNTPRPTMRFRLTPEF